MTSPISGAFQLLPRRLRWRWYALLPLVMMTAAVEAACAAAIFGLLRVLTEPAAAARLATVWPAALILAEGGHRAMILSVTASILALYVLRFIALGFVALLKERIASDSVVVLSGRLLDAYLRGPFSKISRRPSSELVQRVQRATELTVSLGFASLIHLAAEMFVVIGLVVLLAFTAPSATLFAVLATAILLLLPAAATRSVFERYGEEEQAFGHRLLQHLREGLGALREIRVYGREAFFGDRVLELRKSLAGVQRRHSLLSDVMRLGVETVFVVVLLLLILIVTLRGGGSSVVSVLGLYGYAGFRLVPSANRITLNLTNIRRAVASARDLCADTALALPRAKRDELEVRFEDGIVFETVSFRYQDSGLPVLRDVDFRIRRGEAIGIVGSSGAGKSTLADLLLGLLEPTSGRILVDGVDIAGGRASWQKHIGYVAQTSYFLDDTLRRNIAFGLDASEVDEARMAEAVRAARLEPLVRSLPKGLDSPVGEGGARLSGGERQRVAIARALYGRPAVLIFDEATSAVDPGTERELVDALSALRGTRTVVSIAHRASTVRDSNRIVMLKDGRIHATGTFDELMAGNEDFRALMAADEPPSPGND